MKLPSLARSVPLALFAAFLATSALHAENTAAVAEVLKLKDAGVSEITIITYIQTKNLNFGLSADNILSLREKGISPDVLNAMLTSGGAVSGNAPAPVVAAPAPTQQPQPVVQPSQPAVSSQPVVVFPGVAPQPAANPDVSYFYQELSPHGRWILTEDGQTCWQPTLVLTSPGWRPYWDKGRWIWSDHGWYWTSDYPWGWAAFHYGRWNLHPHHGWIWYPDRMWGPAWVTWRSGGEYSGWAPLPYGAVYDVAAGRFLFHGTGVAVDFDFGLRLAHFSFCFSRELGEPMRQRFRSASELREVYRHTTVQHRYTVNHVVVGGETRMQVFNHGVDPVRRPDSRGGRPEPVRIEEMHTPAPGRAHEHLDRGNRTLEVYRPRFGGHH